MPLPVFDVPIRRRAPALRRLAADLIDRGAPCPLLACVFPPWLIVVILYDLLRDGFADGRSAGKRLMGLQTVVVVTGAPCTVGRSILRNALWAATRLCYSSVTLLPLGLAYDLTELLLVVFSPTGQRMGDRLAGTCVVAPTLNPVPPVPKCADMHDVDDPHDVKGENFHA